MSGFLPDTSCMVAALCSWHENHEAAAGEVNRRLGSREILIVAAPALVEAYAVLTRLPPPHRLAAADALAVLEASFMQAGRIVALDSRSYQGLLRDAAAEGIAGGQTYDSVIVRCALRAKASTLLTFNARHFLPILPPDVSVVVPGASAGKI